MWSAVDGVVLLDKPAGLSSNHALQAVRRAYNAAKGGHTGTLDPMASGLLPLCLGDATKFSQTLLDADKAYRATLRFGETTTTGDAEGEVVKRRVPDFSVEALDEVLSRFKGEIEQVPPMFSALKRDGKPLYAYAREGIELHREPRRVTIGELSRGALAENAVTLDVRCSKGTYIRTLAEDIGEALGCGAHLTALRRTRVGPFCLEQATPLAAIEQDPVERARALGPVDLLLMQLSALDLETEAAGRFLHGQSVAFSGPPAGLYRVLVRGRFIGLGEMRPDDRLLPRRLVAERPDA